MFSVRLKELRKEMNKTQEQVAQSVGITRPAYTAYESGKRQPDFEMLKKLAEYFNVSADYLLGTSPNKHYYDLTEKDKRGIDKQIEDMMSGVSDNSLAYFQNGAELDDDDKRLMAASLRQVLETSRVLAKKKFTPKKYRDDHDDKNE
ncbi:helix-turn-helix transcriptional regulator [Latilactobacillus curvatus]|uniref:helix-turn-helix domain-containing protein n=1 Tax=Latilactobacillus curvatus TaxID=28038 RepID=UPI0024110769|nr:helix-turn-helix transcriptional regulator [Latilactobacillus curvatus]MDG2979645.1 helix-turn-helix transcriptional regulator [Latilactobacillus curvatus]WCZ54983.1 Cro/CI family XRE family transcriptional regulator [Latilactobacillus phage TMW 1.2272 P1]